MNALKRPLIFAIVFLGLAGCGDSKLDVMVGDYNAQLEAVQEASRETQRNIERDKARSPGAWQNPDIVAASDREFKRVGEQLRSEVQKAISLREEISSVSGFSARYRYGKYLEDDEWARIRLSALNESPFRYIERLK